MSYNDMRYSVSVFALCMHHVPVKMDGRIAIILVF